MRFAEVDQERRTQHPTEWEDTEGQGAIKKEPQEDRRMPKGGAYRYWFYI